jgi:hypothetical protein
VRDKISHPYSTTGKITVLYILIFRFFDMRRKTKDFGLNNSKHSLNLIYYWFHQDCHLPYINSPKKLNKNFTSTFLKRCLSSSQVSNSEHPHYVAINDSAWNETQFWRWIK